jgi:Transposase IS116/IS110/IS902 family
MGWYREVQVKSYGGHYVRAVLRVRSLLVRSRCDFENQVRGLLKIFGLRLGKTGRKGFAKRMAELLEKQPELEALVAALLKVRETIVEQIATLDAGLQRIAKGSATIRRLMTVPGIGPITALAFASAIDDPSRFRKASSVGAYFGLTPRRLPVRRDRSAGPRLEGGRRDGETLPVRGCGGVADQSGRLVAAQGMGREVEQTDRLAAGRGRARAQTCGHFALHLGGWHRVLVDPN